MGGNTVDERKGVTRIVCFPSPNARYPRSEIEEFSDEIGEESGVPCLVATSGFASINTGSVCCLADTPEIDLIVRDWVFQTLR
jgi:hypothetical protein